MVLEQTERPVLAAREMKREPKNDPLPAVLLAPFFAQSLTLVPRSLLLNRKETLATQAKDHAVVRLINVLLMWKFTALEK